MRGKTVLVTGASGGIGQAVALELAKRGFAVAAFYHKNGNAAKALCRKIEALGGKALSVCADLTDPAQAESAVAEAEARFGKIDALVNNAGTADQRLFCDITNEGWRAMLDIHVNAAFYCTKAVLPAMIARKEGAIVNISSMWGVAGASCEVHYSTAKAALIGMTKALAKEVGPSGIRVNCVAPGVIQTPMLAEFSEGDLASLAAETPLGRLGTPEDAAFAVSFLLSAEASFITGQVISPSGGFIM